MNRVDIGMSDRDPAHMQLEDDRLFPRDLRTAILTPSKGGFDNPTFRDLARIVAPVEREIRALATDAVAKEGIAPPQPAVQRPGVWIDQQFVGIEAVPV